MDNWDEVNEDPGDPMDIDSDEPMPRASITTLPTEVVQQICENLGQNVGSVRRTNRRFAVIGRPYLVPHHYRLSLGLPSLTRLYRFANDPEWQQRITKITYRVDHRTLERAVNDNFSDTSAKQSRRHAYFTGRQEQQQQHESLIKDGNNGKILVSAAKLLPKLREIGVEGFRCADRPVFIPGIEETFENPLGFAELLSVLRAIKSSRSNSLKELSVRNVDQAAFGPSTAPIWTGSPNQLSLVTKMSLLLNDGHCRATLVECSLENLTGFFGVFPNLEELVFGVNVCDCGDCLGDIMSPPGLDGEDRFMDISTSGMSNESWRIPTLRTIRFVHVRWTGRDLVQFIENHRVTLKNLELDEFQLAEHETMDWVDLGFELAEFADLDFRTSKTLTPPDSRPMRVYDEGSDSRLNTEHILRRRNGMDYRVWDNTVSIRTQRGGVLGEDIVLDHW